MENNRRRIRLGLVLCLAGVYFLLAMGAVLLGSGVYRSVSADAETAFTQRTALSYVANQLRRGGRALVGSFSGHDALCLREQAEDGTVFVTLIYCSGGALRELYMEEGAALAPEDGIAVLELEGLELSPSGGILTVTAEEAGGSRWSVSLSPRMGIEEVGAL